MIINTKFSMEEEVFFMCGNKVTKGVIGNIKVFVSNDRVNEFDPVIRQVYSIRGYNGDYDQHELFKTKEKLIKAL